MAHVAITHEDLAFDLRALADANPVQVQATYQLRNDAALTSASLVFLADHALTGSSTFAVTFDGAAVAVTPTTLTQLPNAWKPPTSTPSLIEGAAPARQWASFGDLSVRVQLPPGWRARALPDLTRNGDSLEGQFSGMPADGLAMSASFPLDPHLMSLREWTAPIGPSSSGCC